MSSPIAKKNKNLFDRILIFIHRKISHKTRVSILANEFAGLLSDFINMNPILMQKPVVKVADVGCGDMSLGLEIERLVHRTMFTFLDVHFSPDPESDRSWQRYIKFNGVDIPFESNFFDFAIFSDVLHHVSDSDKDSLFSSALRSSRFVLIKDHYEYGFLSRLILKLMDFIGNYGYGVSVPQKYFCKDSFASFCKKNSAEMIYMKEGLSLYPKLTGIKFLGFDKLHFVAVCKLSGE